MSPLGQTAEFSGSMVFLFLGILVPLWLIVTAVLDRGTEISSKENFR